MSTTVSFNGSSYTVPALADASWGINVSNYLIAIATGCLQKTGGTFTLTAEVNFGATYGIKAAYLKSQTANIASAGYISLAKTDAIKWRNNANGADLALAIDTSDRLTYGGNPITSLAFGAANTVLRMNSGGTATEYAKLTTSNLDAAAGIVDTQLATISTAGKVSNSATTAASANTASAIVARDGSGNFTAGTITAALTGNASTATTAAGLSATLVVGSGGTGQTTAAAAFKALAAYTAKGDLVGYDGAARGLLAVGADGTILQADAASTYGIKWGTAFVNPMATTGDMVYGGVSGASTKLATGATAGVLTGGNGAVPAWSTSLAGTYTIGTAGSSTQTINGLGLLSYSDAQTSANSNNSHEMRRLSTGTAAVGFGGRLRLSLQNASGTTTDGAALTWTWTNATASSEAATLAFETRTAGGALSTKGSVTGTGNWTLGTGTSNSHTFNGDLSSTGTATIGSTSGTTARHTIQAQPTSLSTQALDLKKQSFTKNQNNNLYLACVASDGDEGYLQTNGSAVLGITDASDKRWKKNVRNAEYGLKTIMALRPVTFDWIVGPPNVKGFIAQEVKTVLPESVSILDQSDKEDGLPDAHFLETATMIPVLVRAVQELKAEIEALKAAKTSIR